MLWILNAFSLNLLRGADEARLTVRVIDEGEARSLAVGGVSAVGHADTAALFSSLLGCPIEARRATVALGVGDAALVGQLHGQRLPEGASSLPADAVIVWYLVRLEAVARSVATDDAGNTSVSLPPSQERVSSGPSDTQPSPDVDVDPAPDAVGPSTMTDTRSLGELCRELTKAVAWSQVPRARELRAIALERFPEALREVDDAEQDGHDQVEAVARLQHLARTSGPDSEAFTAFAHEVIARWRFLRNKVEGLYGHFVAQRDNAERRGALARAGRPLSSVRLNRDPRVLALKPSPRWTVLIDETGENFGEVGAKGREGRFVAVILPGHTRLRPPPSGFHATKATDDQLDWALQHLLDADSGILGVTLRDLPPTPGERWVDGVLELVDWLLLLLPRAEGAPVEIDVRVEARGAFVPGQDWETAARDLLRRHASRDPSSVDGVSLSIRTFGKLHEPLLGYADLVAHTWNAGSDATRARLQGSELRGLCLMEGSAPALRALWNGFTREQVLSPEAWVALIDTPACDDPNAIAGLLAGRLAEIAQAQPAVWQGYVDAALAHLDSKAVDLRRLGRQLGWLAMAAPEGERLPPLARHAWARARLTEANHRGAVDSDAEREVAELGESLLAERSPVVCEGDLLRAVIATNRFAFEEASAVLARWSDVDVRVPGLQMWARVQSSLGQHLAFQGRHADALACFDLAIEAFGGLSDPRLAAAEQRHTGAYRAIVMMDDPEVSDADARRAVEDLLGPIDDALLRLPASVEPRDKYALHVLLRWTWHRGDVATRARVVATAKKWAAGEGHPWSLICLYRAVLLEEAGDAVGALDWLREGVRLAWNNDEGPTVRFIGLVVAALLAIRGEADPRSGEAIARLRAQLPAAASRIDRVEREVAAPGEVHTFLAEVLPFNFR